jgi:signal transduction histidine kinase
MPEFLREPTSPATGETLFNYRRIWWYTILGMASVSIIPLLILAVWNVVQFKAAAHAEARATMSNVVADTKQSLLLFLDERKSALHFIVQDNPAETLTDPSRLASILNSLKISLGDIVDLGYVGENGEQTAYVGPYNLQGVNYREEPWFREVTLRGTYISDVFLGFRDFPHLVIADRHERPDGSSFVLRMTVDTQKLYRIIGAVQRGNQDDAFLVNQSGVIQTPSRSYGNVLEPAPLSVPTARDPIGLIDTEDRRGREIMLGFTRVEGTPFTLLVMKPAREFLGGWDPFLEELIAFLVISSLVILAVIVRAATRTVGGIYEADRKRMQFLRDMENTNKMASIGRLAAGVAHEINNPLAIINEKAGLLRDVVRDKPDAPRPELCLQTAESIIKSVERCGAVTYRLLGFARHIDVRIESIDPKALLEEVLGFMGKEAEYRNITVRLEVHEGTPTLRSDRGQLQQVFLNIINNAFAAVQDGGRIDIEVAPSDPDRIAVSVRDDGAGISGEHLPHIFEPFFTTKGQKGTGLGLSITYGIVKKLGGTIQVASAVGRGTTFIVVLPVRKV